MRRREAFALGTAALRALTERFREQRSFSLLFATAFAAMGIVLTSDLLILTTAGFGIVAYLMAVYVLHRGALRLVALRGARRDTREQLRAGLDVVEETLRYNRRWVLVGTPVLAAAGFVIGVSQREGATVAEVLAKPDVLYVLAPALAVAIVVGTWAALWYGDRPYKRALADLRAALAGVEG